MAGKLKKGQKVFSRPRDDSYLSFKGFIIGFANALGGEQASDQLDEAGEREMRKTYRAFLAARRKSGEPLVNPTELPEE